MNSKDCNCFCLDTVFDRADFTKTFYLVWTLAFMYVHERSGICIWLRGVVCNCYTMGLLDIFMTYLKNYKGCTGRAVLASSYAYALLICTRQHFCRKIDSSRKMSTKVHISYGDLYILSKTIKNARVLQFRNLLKLRVMMQYRIKYLFLKIMICFSFICCS